MIASVHAAGFGSPTLCSALTHENPVPSGTPHERRGYLSSSAAPICLFFWLNQVRFQRVPRERLTLVSSTAALVFFFSFFFFEERQQLSLLSIRIYRCRFPSAVSIAWLDRRYTSTRQAASRIGFAWTAGAYGGSAWRCAFFFLRGTLAS